MGLEVKFLPNVFTRLRERRRDTAVSHAISGTTAAVSGWYGSVFSTTSGGMDVQQAVSEALEKVIWVYRCCDAIATNQSKLPLIVREGDPYDGKITKRDEDLFNLLNRRTNIYETAQDFRYRLSMQLLLSKRGVFIEKGKGQQGRRMDLHLLPPWMVEPIPDPETFVAGYRFYDQIRGEILLEKEKVMWLKLKPHPMDPYLQLTPLAAAGLAVETDWLSRIYNRNFLLNDGRPGLLVAIQGELDSTDAEEIKTRFSGGPFQSGKTVVVEADGISVEDPTASPRDLQWLEAIQGSKEDILLAFGTPESVLGNASGRTYDNADAEKENWWEETEQPHCNAIARGLDPLTGSVSDDKYISFDYDEVDVLQRRRRARNETKAAQFAAGVATLDDVLKERGEDPINVPASRSYFLPNGVVVARNAEDQEAVAQLPTIGVEQMGDVQRELLATQQAAQNGTQQALDSWDTAHRNEVSARAVGLSRSRFADFDTSESSSFLGIRRAGYKPPIEAKAVLKDDSDDSWVELIDPIADDFHPYAEERMFTEGQFEGLLDAWSSAQERIITERLDHVKIRKFTRHWKSLDGSGVGNKALDPMYAVEIERWSSDLSGDIESFMRRIASKAMESAAESLEEDGLISTLLENGLGHPKGRSPMGRVFGPKAELEDLVNDLLRPLNAIVGKSASRQSARVAQKIRELDAAGHSLTDIKREIKSLIGKRSSWREGLSRTLTTSIFEGVKHKMYEPFGDLASKTWRTYGDEKVRPSHRKAGGQERRYGSNFRVGKSWLMHPGDTKGGPEETANCRCWCDYQVYG